MCRKWSPSEALGCTAARFTWLARLWMSLQDCWRRNSKRLEWVKTFSVWFSMDQHLLQLMDKTWTMQLCYSALFLSRSIFGISAGICNFRPNSEGLMIVYLAATSSAKESTVLAHHLITFAVWLHWRQSFQMCVWQRSRELKSALVVPTLSNIGIAKSLEVDEEAWNSQKFAR